MDDSKVKVPLRLARIRPLVMLIASFVSVWRYLRLNRGIRLDDFRYIKFNDVKRFITGWDCADVVNKSKFVDSRKDSPYPW